PLRRATEEARKNYHRPEKISFVGLVKPSMPRKFLSPRGPEVGEGLPYAVRWLQINIPEMQQQLPYPVLPVYLEIMATTVQSEIKEDIVRSESGRADILTMSSKDIPDPSMPHREDTDFPIPVFDIIVPPGRHFGYVFEWAFMAILTISIGILLQLKRTVIRG